MADLLDKGLAWLDAMNREHRAVGVRYCRQGTEILLPAVIGRTTFQYARENGPFERFESRDFIVSATDLVLEDLPFLPRAGDRILEERDGVMLTHEVMDLDDEPCFRWCDPYRRTLRIHSKTIAVGES